MTGNKMVELKNGTMISEELLVAYNALLRLLYMTNAIALRDYSLYCRNENRQMHPVNVRLMQKLDILQSDGSPYPGFKDFVLCAVIGDGIDMEIVDPRKLPN